MHRPAQLVRAADPERDAARCAAIYQPFVSAGFASFEEVPPGEAEMTQRIARTTRTHPWLVVESAGEVSGYAYASPHRARAAYRWTAEVAVYVDPAQHRRGLGRALYDELIPLLAAQRLHTALAGITLPNPASVALHESFGFRRAGIFAEIGWKAGAWRDVAWWQLRLGSGAKHPPPEPEPPRPA